MKRYRWSIIFSAALISISVLSYLLQIEIFHDARDTYFYMLQDFAFVPVQVLLVTLLINDLLSRRQKLELQNKLNMIIGAFYSEMGTKLLQCMKAFDGNACEMLPHVMISAEWDEQRFDVARTGIAEHRYSMNCQISNLSEIKTLLLDQRPFLLSLIANPNLLEHDTFTDLLWAISHLTEELAYRDGMDGLPSTDYAHIANDMQRAYHLLLLEWLAYVRHLHHDYPYIYSLLVRINPFSPTPSPIVHA